jgi:putative ABC transport system permease protein
VIWLYRLLLRLYPRDFRRAYAEEMLDAFACDLTRSRRHGIRAVVAFLFFIGRDLAGSAMRQRYRQLSRAAAPSRGAPRLPQRERRGEMETLFQDVRYAARQFVRQPLFALVAVVSLGLAIGGNSLIYGMIDGFVLHPFPYPDPDRLVSVGVTFPKLSSETSYVEVLSPAEYADIKSNRSFAQTAAFDLGNRNISGGDVPERVFTALVLDDPFPVVGMKPVLGRGFTPEELGQNGPAVAIISHRLWQSQFGGDPAILNRPIRIGGVGSTIVGVMPPGLLLIGTDLWIPWGGDPAGVPRNVRQFTVLARLAPGATAVQANAELATIAGRVELAEGGTFKEYQGWRLTATPWASALMQDVRPGALILLGAVGFVLLIACANLTNLVLARSTTRQRELAVRLALGAARWRLARHLLTESLLLALAGGLLGLGVAYLGLRFADVVIPAQFRMLGLHAGLSLRVLVWSLVLASASGLLVGLLPALLATRTDPHDSLKGDVRAGGARAGRRLRQALVVAEIALSVVLLLGAGLLVRSFANIRRLDTGFDPRGVLTMRLTLPRERYDGKAVNAFFNQLVERVSAVPGVRAVSASSQFPPIGAFGTQFALEQGGAAGTTLPTALITVATPRHFETLRVPLHAGRAFMSSDRLDTPPVAIVNEAFAARYLSGTEPIGRRLTIGSSDRPRPWTTIVGVVADFRNNGASQPTRPEIFVPVEQQSAWNQLFLLVRTDMSPAAVLPDIRQTLAALDREQPIYAIQTLEEAMATSSFQQRISAVLLTIFAALALLLAAIGIYGVMSYSVSARTQEMGVRLAIGAQRRTVIWLVIKQVLTMSVVGLAIGIALLLVAGRSLERLLFGVTTLDPVTIAIVSAVLGLVAIVAAWAPAARAARVDPIVALRYE